jgi:hypothetical protein
MYDACACFILFLTVESHLQWNPLIVHLTILKISSTETTDSKPLPFYKQSKSSWDWSICITAYSRRLADLHGQGFHHTGSPFSGSSSHGMRGCCKHGYRNGACHGDFAGCKSSPLVVFFSRSCGCVARGPFGDPKIWTCICLFASEGLQVRRGISRTVDHPNGGRQYNYEYCYPVRRTCAHERGAALDFPAVDILFDTI